MRTRNCLKNGRLSDLQMTQIICRQFGTSLFVTLTRLSQMHPINMEYFPFLEVGIKQQAFLDCSWTPANSKNYKPLVITHLRWTSTVSIQLLRDPFWNQLFFSQTEAYLLHALLCECQELRKCRALTAMALLNWDHPSYSVTGTKTHCLWSVYRYDYT